MKKLTVMLAVMLASVSIFCACGTQTQVAEPVVEATTTDEETEEVTDEATDETAEETTDEATDETAEETTDEATDETAEETTDETTDEKLVVVGEGEIQFVFEIVDADGNVTKMAVNTDKKTVGEALVDNELVEGEDSEYGLYVKTVNGITADYDVDQTYWAFYIDGEYATTGVDQTDIVAGSTYSFKVEK